MRNANENSNLYRRRAGLTMVEMVVVFAICGVLAALLVPMLMRSRSNARAIVCTDNLKSLGHAFSVCLMESNGVLPDAYYNFQGFQGSYTVSLKSAPTSAADPLLKSDVAQCLTCPADDTPVTVVANSPAGGVASMPASYAYNVALPLMYRNAARVPDSVNTVTFYDGNVNKVVGSWDYCGDWAGKSVDNRHRNESNYLYMDGHVERSGTFPNAAFDGGAMWLASSRDARPPATPNNPAPAPAPVDFTINSNGGVVLNEDCGVTITCLGAQFQNGVGGPRIPVAAYYRLNDNGAKTLITNDVQGGETASLSTVGGSTEVAIIGKTTQYYQTEIASDNSNGHVWVLRNGDPVPTVAGYAGQKPLAAYVAPYVDDGGHVMMGPNDVIYLFELAQSTDWHKSPSADFNDLCVLVTLNKKLRNVSGAININPSNSSSNEFQLTLPDGFTVTRDDLKSDAIKLHAGFNNAYLDYSGPAASVVVRPKGNGNQNSLIVDGNVYSLRNSNRYTIMSNNMTVHLYNDKRNGNKAMGKWYITISATNATVKVYP